MHINEKESGITYTKRPGAYIIITRNEDNKIAIVKEKNKYFYFGGGIENNEEPIEALKRELIEELGYTLKNVKPYKILNSYEYSYDKGYLDVTSNIFLGELDKKVTEPIEKDHDLIWINPQDYIGKMYHFWHNYILDVYTKEIKDNIEK